MPLRQPLTCCTEWGGMRGNPLLGATEAPLPSPTRFLVQFPLRTHLLLLPYFCVLPKSVYEDLFIFAKIDVINATAQRLPSSLVCATPSLCSGGHGESLPLTPTPNGQCLYSCELGLPGLHLGLALGACQVDLKPSPMAALLAKTYTCAPNFALRPAA
jgi:hypothetical protein